MARVFSGIQPTGNLTIGNYLGALKRFVDYQDDHECFYCVVDLHALTVMPDPAALREGALSAAALFIAAGVDPAKAHIFLQSQVPAHSEMAWLLQCMSYFGELSRMTQFKEKKEKILKEKKDVQGVTTGLFTYPVLMAADILLYDTEIVPVGIDQKQHVELARNIAQRANQILQEGLFIVPEPKIAKIGGKIMSLRDPSKKMSKSDPLAAARINMLDEPEVIIKKLRKAKTDSDNEIRYDPENKAGVSNLLVIQSLCSGESIESIERDYEGKGYGDLKRGAAEAIIATLQPVQERYKKLRATEEVLDILRYHADQAQTEANKVLQRYQKAVGLLV